MKHPGELRIEDYQYSLPAERIAAYPLPERDASKLLLYKNGVISEGIYHNLPDHIPADTLLVFNQTRVVHARLRFLKDTGATIEVFCLEPHQQYPDIQSAMAQKDKVWWKCLIGGASKWKHGAILEMKLQSSGAILSARIVERQDEAFIVELSWDKADMSFAEILQEAGQVPLPPYIHRKPQAEDDQRYQTIYAREEGSVAAPTAGLHFTDRLLDRLREKGVDISFVTLHVGAGTFKPVKADTMWGHEMHAEWIDVPLDLIDQLTSNLSGNIVAVGTTSLRTLESLYWLGAKLLKHRVPDIAHIALSQWEPYTHDYDDIPAAHALQALKDWMLEQNLARLVTRTQLLIAPGYPFRIVNGLITNFHQPGSTLLLLVAAFIGEDWHRVYDHALNNGFRFLSYGDGCLLWAKEDAVKERY